MPPPGGLNGNKSNGVSEVFPNFYLLSLPLRRVYCIAKHIAELLEFLDHMARTAPSYLFINRHGAIDWNLCVCCVSKIIEESSKII